MSKSALAARGINKRFGSLVVAADVDLTLPPGARYALIGPNGAGKTTLINLMTGMLRPDAGQILLGGEDVTTLAPEDRVRRGLARTYQINSLFPHLTALESVALAVCERRRVAQTWWRRLIGILRGRVEAHSGYAVNGLEAINLLALKDPLAAAWWRENCAHLLDGKRHVVFPAGVCQEC